MRLTLLDAQRRFDDTLYRLASRDHTVIDTGESIALYTEMEFWRGEVQRLTRERLAAQIAGFELPSDN